MVSILLRGAVAATAIMAASSAFAGVNLITNGDFSSPNENGGWSNLGPTWDGWTTSASNGIEIGASPIYGLPGISPGGQNLELNGNAFGTDSYTVSNLVVGKTYDLFYDYGGRTSGGPSSAVTTFGGVPVASNSGSVGAWTPTFVVVTATSTSETLTFTANDTGDSTYGNEYTNVSLTAAVPEASTWAMMGLGFAGLGFSGFRARRVPVSIA